MKLLHFTRLSLFVALLFTTGSASAEVRPAKVFADNMVLQQERPITVWGWADPGEKVTVQFADQTATTATDDNGHWRAELPAMKADLKPHTLTIAGTNTVALKNVLLGEVWLASGQSNMGRQVKVTDSHPNLRLFWRAPKEQGVFPRRDDFADEAGWCAASPEALAATPPALFRDRLVKRDSFGEVAYVFGRKIHEELKVPVGVIWIAHGGSTAAAWVPRPGIEKEYPFDQKVEGGYLGHREGLMYQAKLMPVVPLAIRGVIWYQGEDDGRNRKYAESLTTLIKSWRGLWGREDLPFYFVQIAQTTYASGMLGVWEAQVEVMHSVPHTGLAVSNDIYENSNWKGKIDEETGWPLAGGSNPHPPNKHVVAGRLAEIALVKTYGRPSRPIFGPMYDSHRIEGERIKVKFKYADQGLAALDKKDLNWFEISDGSQENRKLKYVKAQAKIVAADTVEVWAPEIKDPKFVRFAWHSMARHNLINKAGLPAVSFRTDRQEVRGWR